MQFITARWLDLFLKIDLTITVYKFMVFFFSLWTHHDVLSDSQLVDELKENVCFVFCFLKYYPLTSCKKSQSLLPTPARRKPRSSLFPHSLTVYLAVRTTIQYRLLLGYWQHSVLPWVFPRKWYIKGKKKLFNWIAYPQKEVN